MRIIGFTPVGVALAERLTHSCEFIDGYFVKKPHSEVCLIEQASSIDIDVHWQGVGLLGLLNLLKQCRVLLLESSKIFGVNVSGIEMNEKLLYSYLKLVIERVQKYYLTLLRQRRVKLEFREIPLDLSNQQILHFADNTNQMSELSVYPMYLVNQLDKQSIDIDVETPHQSTEHLLYNTDFQLKQKSWPLYFHKSTRSTVPFDDQNNCINTTSTHSSYPEFDRSIRLNLFHALFQHLLQYSSLKLIGPDSFAFELAYLLSSLGRNQVYLYRMNPRESSIISNTESNTHLVTLFHVFSKIMPEPLIRPVSIDKHRPTLHIAENFYKFKLNSSAEGELESDTFIDQSETALPASRTTDDIRKMKRTYLETLRQRTQETLGKTSTSRVHIGMTKMCQGLYCNEILFVEESNIKIEIEPRDSFPPTHTFFILPDMLVQHHSHPSLGSSVRSADKKQPVFPKAIRSFNITPGSLIQNIYETLRTIVGNETTPRLTNLFLSVDQELCVLQNQITIKQHEFGVDQIIESQQHQLQRATVNSHDFYKLTQRPINSTGQLTFCESQLFQMDALNLQSLLLLFNPEQEIPENELILLFRDEREWYQFFVLPDHMIMKTLDKQKFK